MDMSYPITEYFIYTSHNTYVSGNKYNSDSKLEMYEINLKKGCRCIELDIMQTKEDALIVKHKSSQNNILLEDVLRTIKNVGFTFNSFPIIVCV